MDNVIFQYVERFGEITTHIVIDHGNNQFTSMTKEEYDRQQAEQSTPNLAD